MPNDLRTNIEQKIPLFLMELKGWNWPVSLFRYFSHLHTNRVARFVGRLILFFHFHARNCNWNVLLFYFYPKRGFYLFKNLVQIKIHEENFLRHFLILGKSSATFEAWTCTRLYLWRNHEQSDFFLRFNYYLMF